MDGMDDEVTITVSRADLGVVLRYITHAHPGLPMPGSAVSLAVERVRAAIPEPEWHPSDEQVDAWQRAFPGTRYSSITSLTFLHREGLIP